MSGKTPGCKKNMHEGWAAVEYSSFGCKRLLFTGSKARQLSVIRREACINICYYTHTHTHLTAIFSGTTCVSWYQKGNINLDFCEARDSEWQWHQLGHMQVCTLLQTDNHASTPPLSFLQARCPSCCPTNSVKALKAKFDISY